MTTHGRQVKSKCVCYVNDKATLYGRKKALLISVLGTRIASVAFAWSKANSNMIQAQLSFYTDLRRELRSIILLLANDFNMLQHLTWSLLTTIVNTVLLEKLIVAHLVENIRSLCWTPRSINIFRNSPINGPFLYMSLLISPPFTPVSQANCSLCGFQLQH